MSGRRMNRRGKGSEGEESSRRRMSIGVMGRRKREQ
jgi:hypothetical protein